MLSIARSTTKTIQGWIDKKVLKSQEWVDFRTLGYRDFEKNLKRVKFPNNVAKTAYTNGWLSAELDANEYD